jgi:hypothetical protein
MERGPRLSPEGEYLPDKRLAALQLLRACNCLTYLETRGWELKESYGQVKATEYGQMLDTAKRGVRLVIFARFGDLVSQGDAPIGRFFLPNARSLQSFGRSPEEPTATAESRLSRSYYARYGHRDTPHLPRMTRSTFTAILSRTSISASAEMRKRLRMPNTPPSPTPSNQQNMPPVQQSPPYIPPTTAELSQVQKGLPPEFLEYKGTSSRSDEPS